MRIRNNKGVALIISLLVIVILITLGKILLIRVITERNVAQRQKQLFQSFYVGESGAQDGLKRLETLINSHLIHTINITDPNVISSKCDQYFKAKSSLGFLREFVKSYGVPQLQLNDNKLTFVGDLAQVETGAYQYKITITQKGDPLLIAAERWEFPYYFKIESTGISGDISRKIIYTGDFTVKVQRDSFAKYILFGPQNTDNPAYLKEPFIGFSSDISDKIIWQEG